MYTNLHYLDRFQYIWSDKEYMVYYFTWQNVFEAPTQMFYILYPRASTTITSSGHCPETDALILAAGKWTSQLHDEIFVFDDGDWVKSKDLYKAVASSSWNDVILSPETKKSLIEDVHGFFDNQALYAQFSVPWKRGIILHGVPGNGKTVSIKALMSSLYERSDHSIPSLYVKSFETNCNTEQYAIRAIFQRARSMAPCLLIFEDLDSLVHDDIRSYFLNEVDGLESNDGILMIGSTNHLDKLDPAIAKRPSRFDRKYHFKIPGPEERKGYAEYWRAKLVKNEVVDFPDEVVGLVAELTEGFSFAYMKELFVMSLLCLVRGWTPEEDGEKESDAEENKDADENEDDKEKKDEEEDPEKCSCKPRCGTCDKLLPTADGEAEKKANEEKESDKEVKENKLVLKQVEVPEHLKGNLLLRVIQHQIRVLHAEMDNSTDEGKGDEEEGSKRRRRGRGRRY